MSFTAISNPVGKPARRFPNWLECAGCLSEGLNCWLKLGGRFSALY